MSKKVPEGIVIAGHLYLERDALVKRMQKMKKIALRSWDDFYDRRMQEWLDAGEEVDIRAERENKKQTAKNISNAIDGIIKTIGKLETE